MNECVVLDMGIVETGVRDDEVKETEMDMMPMVISKELLRGPKTVLLPSEFTICASSVFHENYVEYAHKAGADPNISSCGSSPLALAARENNTCFLRSLLAAGANPNSCTTDLLGPIEHAAEVGNFEGVRILFLVTDNIVSCYPDWSIRGIKDHHHSEAYKMEKKLSRDGYFQFVYEEGKNAAKEKDYSEAVKWFSEAIYLQPNNETLLSYRSIFLGKFG